MRWKFSFHLCLENIFTNFIENNYQKNNNIYKKIAKKKRKEKAIG